MTFMKMQLKKSLLIDQESNMETCYSLRTLEGQEGNGEQQGSEKLFANYKKTSSLCQTLL